MPRAFVTIDEIAQMVRVTPGTVRKWVDNGELMAERVDRRTVQISSSELEALLVSRFREAGAPASAHPTGEESEEPHAHRRLTAGTARMATATGVRQVLSTAALAITAALVARYLGPRNFGIYAGGTSGYNLANSITDLGFSLVLVREMSRRPADEPRLMGTAIYAQILWSVVLSCGLVLLGVLAGGERGLVMFALSPAIALNGLAVSRQIFSVRFRATPLLVMDVSTTILQCAIMVALAVAHAPVVVLAINLSAWTSISGILALVLARKMVAVSVPTRPEVLAFIRTAIPLGIASVLASLYFIIDQTLLGWLVSPTELGHYAAAVRLLTIVVTIPGFIMSAGVVGLSASGKDRVRLSRFAATLAHWIAVSALPLSVALAVFARPAVLLLFGSHYLAAVPLVRILMIAGLLAFVSNVLGIVLMTQGIVRPQILFNAISLAVNVTGNVLLAPRYGVVASAWLTVLSEAIVISYGIVVLRRRLSYPIICRRVWRPVAATGLAGGVGLILGGSGALPIACSVTIFLLTLTVMRGWPIGPRAAPSAS
jgi:excisionase family DNA binding protein